MPEGVQAVLDAPLTRRSFMKWSGVAGGAAVATGVVVRYGLMPLPAEAAAKADGAAPTMVWSSCNVNCGSRCPLRMTVTDGTITRIDPDSTGDDEFNNQQIRACVRGRSIRQRIYSPERIKYPMKRTGKRGEDQWQQISWDQALDEIAQRLKDTIAKYGNESVFIHYGSGATGGKVSASGSMARLMNLIGGNLGYYNSYSTAQYTFASPYTYGSGRPEQNTFNDVVHTKLLVLWGNNPHETRMSGGGELFLTQKAKRESNAKVIVVDPRLTDTAVTLADEWVPIRPGTDPALIAGMAHVMISENLHDQAFLDTYCLGFDEDHMPEGAPANASYKSYVMGLGADGVEKTPEWASKITGVPVSTITRVAREIAQAKPCMIVQGWGPQRTAAGEQTVRAVYLLAALTGNIGVSGGGTGAREGQFAMPSAAYPAGTNPVKTMIPVFLWTDAIKRGTEMTAVADGVQGADKLSVPIKFIWNFAGNTLINQHSDANATAQILEDDTLCETIVVIDNQLTPSARYADYLLPDTTNVEQVDIAPGGYAGDMGYMILASKAIDPLFESKPSYEIAQGIAQRFGVEDKFTEGRNQEDWVKFLVDETRKQVPDLPTYEELVPMGVYRMPNPKGFTVGYKKFRDDPVANPLGTPSGLIEIYSSKLQDLAASWTLAEGDRITPLPEYTPTWEGPEDPLTSKYPLQMIGHHYKARTHSSYANVPWLREAHPQMIWINTTDAAARDIANGDMVHVYNDRGRVLIQAKVTERIAPGVCSLPQGAWYTPQSDGIDHGGCTNTLTSQRPSALAKGNPQHTNLVEIVKA